MERRTTLREEDQVILAPPLVSTWPKTTSSSSLLTSTPVTMTSASTALLPFPQTHNSHKNIMPMAGSTKGLPTSSSLSLPREANNRTDTPPLPSEEEYSLDFVFACLGSSKQHRYLFDLQTRNCENEDRIFLGKVKLPKNEQQADETALFIGLYDGHGGGGKASSFVSERLKTTFETIIEKNSSNAALLSLSLPERITQALEESFRLVDVEFHRTVKSEAEKANIMKKQATRACCKYFNEDPCVCLNPPISANEGSTGTVVIVTNSYIICANVGDSDAFIVERVHMEEEEGSQVEASASPSSTGSTSTSVASLDEDMPALKRSRLAPALPATPCSHSQVVLTQLTITDTPVPDESNEDYLRIRSIAQRASSIKAAAGTTVFNEKLPKDGILRNCRGDRYNYVAVPGARSLNMVRAFGNLGNKRFVEGNILESESPIISRPHLKIVPRTNRICGIVIGSDGLWDNVDKGEVASVVGKRLLSQGSSKQCAKDLLNRAINARKKPDDVSVIIVPL